MEKQVVRGEAVKVAVHTAWTKQSRELAVKRSKLFIVLTIAAGMDWAHVCMYVGVCVRGREGRGEGSMGSVLLS